MIWKTSAAFWLAFALAGCTVGPDFEAPAAPTEKGYVAHDIAAVPAAPNEAPQHVTSGAGLETDWWTRLNSPALNETVSLALANNRTLAEAQANLAKAGEDLAAAQGALAPQIDAAAGAERRSYGAYFLGPEAATFPKFSAYTAGISASYDLDLFGGTHRRIELAAADADTTREGMNAARLSVAGSTVLTAIQIAGIRAEIATIDAVIASDQKTLDLTLAARRTGVASEVDVTTAQSQLDGDRARLPPLHQELNLAQDALAVMVGKSPADWTAPDFDLTALTLPDNIPLALPSDLVRLRPDIRAAEARLHAANAAIGIATADLYPHLTLTAGIAEEGLTSGPAGAAWSVLGGLTAPIFHGGTLTAQKKAAEDAYQAAFADYQQIVLVAFRQVADGLHGLVNAADGVRTEQQALHSAEDALRLARLGYGVGNAGIVQVLDAQRLQQLAELSLVQARTLRYAQTVNLFVATGGGVTWPNTQETVAQR